MSSLEYAALFGGPLHRLCFDHCERHIGGCILTSPQLCGTTAGPLQHCQRPGCGPEGAVAPSGCTDITGHGLQMKSQGRQWGPFSLPRNQVVVGKGGGGGDRRGPPHSQSRTEPPRQPRWLPSPAPKPANASVHPHDSAASPTDALEGTEVDIKSTDILLSWLCGCQMGS